MINITDIVPSFDNLTVVQSRNVLEFLVAQEHIKNITPPLLYTLVQNVITDAKLSVRNMPADVSFSKLFEKHRIEGNINALLNKIPKEEGQVTENFIESLFFLNANLSEVPSYFVKTLKNVITNGVPTAKTENPEKPAEETNQFFVNQNSYLCALAAHRVFLGPLSATQQQKLLNYTLNPNFSVKRLQRELGGSNERTSRDHSDYDTMMVRGTRIVHKIQERNEAKFAVLTEQRITNEILKDIADGVMKKATQSNIAGRDFQVLQYLSALSDYPDSCFDYKVNEQQVNKMIREAYKNLSIR